MEALMAEVNAAYATLRDSGHGHSPQSPPDGSEPDSSYAHQVALAKLKQGILDFHPADDIDVTDFKSFRVVTFRDVPPSLRAKTGATIADLFELRLLFKDSPFIVRRVETTIALFARMVFWAPTRDVTGIKAYEVPYSRVPVLRRRLARFREGLFVSLYEDMRFYGQTPMRNGKPRDGEAGMNPTATANRFYALATLHEGRQAMTIASSPGVIPFDDETPAKLDQLIKPIDDSGSNSLLEFQVKMEALDTHLRAMDTAQNSTARIREAFEDLDGRAVLRKLRRGAAQSLTGWRGEFWRCLLVSRLEDRLETIKRFLWLYIIGHCPVLELLFDTNRLVTLRKSVKRRTEIRPIGIGESLEKVSDGVWLTLLKEDMRAASLPFGFACAIPAGNEALAKDIQMELESAGDHTSVCKRDGQNFFPTLERFFLILDAGKLCPAFGLYVLRKLRRPTSYTLEIGDSGPGNPVYLDWRTISGIVQGKAVSFMLACVVSIQRMKL